MIHNTFPQLPLHCCIERIKGDNWWTVAVSSLCVWCEQGHMPGCPSATKVLHGCDGTTLTEGGRCGVQPRTWWVPI